MNRYQFDKIYSRMEVDFGRIPKGQEHSHELFLFALESNAMLIHKKYPASNSQRMIEAIGLVLFTIREYCTGETADLSNIRNEDNVRLEHALLYAFDPFTNPDIKKTLTDFRSPVTLEDLRSNRDLSKKFYTEAVKCLCRIKRSADMWIKEMGSDGYFVFLNQTIRSLTPKKDLNFILPFDSDFSSWK